MYKTRKCFRYSLDWHQRRCSYVLLNITKISVTWSTGKNLFLPRITIYHRYRRVKALLFSFGKLKIKFHFVYKYIYIVTFDFFFPSLFKTGFQIILKNIGHNLECQLVTTFIKLFNIIPHHFALMQRYSDPIKQFEKASFWKYASLSYTLSHLFS